MGLLSSSKSVTENTTNVDETAFNLGSVSGGGSNFAISRSPGARVTVSDYDAIDRAFEFAEDALYSSGDTFGDALGAIQKNTQSAIDAASRASVGGAERVVNDVLRYGALAVGLYFISRVFTK
jgi:hypothetical protein